MITEQKIRHLIRNVLSESQINNPSEMTRDEAILYLRDLSPVDVLMNDLYIDDSDTAEDIVVDDEIYGGYTVQQALIILGEEQSTRDEDPRRDAKAERWDEEELERNKTYDDPWSPDGNPWERKYDMDDVDLIDLMVDDPNASVKTIDGEDADEWMNDSNYDLYVEIPMNIHRPDSGPFDDDDVKNIKELVAKRAREVRQYSPGIVLKVYPQVGETMVDTDYEFH